MRITSTDYFRPPLHSDLKQHQRIIDCICESHADGFWFVMAARGVDQYRIQSAFLASRTLRRNAFGSLKNLIGSLYVADMTFGVEMA